MKLGKASLALVVLMGASSMCHAAEDPSPEIDVCDRRARCGDHNVKEGSTVNCIKYYEPYLGYFGVITADEKCIYAIRTCNDKAKQEPFICHSGPCRCNSQSTCTGGDPTVRPEPVQPPRSRGHRRRHRFGY